MSSSIHKCMRIKEYFGTQDVFPDILGMETGKPSFVSSGRRGSFSTVYSDPMGQRCLALHMLRTHASENLRFLLKVQSFREIWQADRSALTERMKKMKVEVGVGPWRETVELVAREIRDSLLCGGERVEICHFKYHKFGERTGINIDGKTRMSLIHRINNNDLSVDMFDEAEEMVRDLVRFDVYPRFMNSREYKQYAMIISSPRYSDPCRRRRLGQSRSVNDTRRGSVQVKGWVSVKRSRSSSAWFHKFTFASSRGREARVEKKWRIFREQTMNLLDLMVKAGLA
ncbi:hypothetical protein AAMO2058_000231900 [Amorphochlora amoebiformis]